ncbi:MAG: hypothetical protein ACK4TR_13755 [Phenylobacterium sp.]|uniref:hypothetical protein n=1 Tax=Phenylobacterium sp. TaxID=1871053 RepID=UPI00391CA0F7
MRKGDWLLRQLETEYAKMLGELEWIENPPKRMMRAAEREAFQAGQDDRRRRAEQLREALPHFEYVIRMYEPNWEASAVGPIRPKQKRTGLLPQGSRAAVMDALHQKPGERQTVAEIVDVIAERYDLDVSTVSARQKLHTLVHKCLAYDTSGEILRDAARPQRWWLKKDGD